MRRVRIVFRRVVMSTLLVIAMPVPTSAFQQAVGETAPNASDPLPTLLPGQQGADPGAAPATLLSLAAGRFRLTKEDCHVYLGH